MRGIKKILILLAIMLSICSCGKDNKIDKYDEYHKVANNLYEVFYKLRWDVKKYLEGNNERFVEDSI